MKKSLITFFKPFENSNGTQKAIRKHLLLPLTNDNPFGPQELRLLISAVYKEILAKRATQFAKEKRLNGTVDIGNIGAPIPSSIGNLIKTLSKHFPLLSGYQTQGPIANPNQSLIDELSKSNSLSALRQEQTKEENYHRNFFDILTTTQIPHIAHALYLKNDDSAPLEFTSIHLISNIIPHYVNIDNLETFIKLSREDRIPNHIPDLEFISQIDEHTADITCLRPNLEGKIYRHDLHLSPTESAYIAPTYKRILQLINDKSQHLSDSDTEYYIEIPYSNNSIAIALFLMMHQGIIPNGKRINIRGGKFIDWEQVLKAQTTLNKRFLFSPYTIESPEEIQTIISESRPPHDTIRGEVKTNSKKYNKIIHDLQNIINDSRCNDPILLTGETGVGKTQLARRINQSSNEGYAKSRPFIAVNCATIIGEIGIGELFGFEEGVYTGQKKGKQDGFLSQANNGILFLDEIGELPASAQAALLKALDSEDKDGYYHFQRVGNPDSGKPKENIKSRFRLICGTNVNLKEAIHNKSFRRDLFARINTWTFRIPSIRERRDENSKEIEDEIDSILQIEAIKLHCDTIRFDSAAYNLFLNFAMNEHTLWEGNWREFTDMVHRMAVRSRGTLISEQNVRDEIEESEYYEEFAHSKVKILTDQAPPPEPSAQGGSLAYDNNVSSILTTSRIEEIPTATTIPNCRTLDDDQIIGLIGVDKFEKLNGRDRCLLRGVIEACGQAKTQKEAETNFYDNDSGALSRFLKKFGLRFKYRKGTTNLECRSSPTILCE